VGAFDKSEGVVKGARLLAVCEHRLLCQRDWGPRRWKSHAESVLRWNIVPPTIDST